MEANFLALNGMHGIVTGAKSVRRGITTGRLSAQEANAHMEQLRLSPRDQMPGSKLGKLSLGRAHPFD
jgi:hypothetical protein